MSDLSHSSGHFVEIDETYLSNYWKELTFNSKSLDCSFGKRYFFEHFKASYQKDKIESFKFNTKGWKIKIAEGATKSILNGSLVYGLLYYLGVFEGMSSVIVPLIIPLLIDIENIKLAKSEEEVYLNMPLDKFKDNFETDQEWYNHLPSEIKQDFSFLNFLDLLDKLYEGGLADRDKKKFKVFDKDERKFRIIFDY